MAKTFHCSVVTPTGTPFDGEVTYASVPAWDGQLGVMAGTSPLLSKLGAGPLRLDPPGETARYFLVDDGFVQVDGESLTLLAEVAVPAEQISREEAAAELAAVKERVGVTTENQHEVLAAQRRAYAKVAVAERATSRPASAAGAG